MKFGHWMATGASLLALAACGADKGGDAAKTEATAAAGSTGTAAVAESAYPERAYFGDTHVHTGWSADAGQDGAVTSPEDAFRLARGDMVKSNTGQDVQLKRAMDWMVITDHSDGMGTINEIRAGNPEMISDPFLKTMYEGMKSGDEAEAVKVVNELIDRQSNGKLPKQVMDPKWMVSAWTKTIAIADKYNEPGKFTALIGYEWTVNAGNGDNLHRNVIYRDAADKAGQALPLTTFQTQDPEKLWEWMANYETKTGRKLLAIPHNGNLSNGRMYEETTFTGGPMTLAYAEGRQKWERLMEVTQIKGQSESHPSLSPADEFANWDLWDRGNLTGAAKKPGMYRTEYWREGLKSGMRLEAKLGANPFKYGANGATDTHTGLSTFDEDNFWGKFKSVEPRKGRWEPMMLGVGKPGAMASWEQAAAGTTGVWAKANTREAIWDAMQRRETFATTGPRMSVRLFGGYDFSALDAGGDLVKTGYAKGVPMGGDLRAAPAGKAPTFLVAAMKDPDGANLDRVQVVKGWLDADGKTYEEMHIDGGTTDNAFLIPQNVNLKAFGNPAWKRKLYIIANNKTGPVRDATQATTVAIIGRSISTMIKQQLEGDLIKLYLRSQKNDVDYNEISIPSTFSEKAKEPFDKAYMRKLYQLGYEMGKASLQWRKKPSGL